MGFRLLYFGRKQHRLSKVLSKLCFHEYRSKIGFARPQQEGEKHHGKCDKFHYFEARSIHA